MRISSTQIFNSKQVNFGSLGHKDCKCGGKGCLCNPLQQVKDHTTMSGLELLAILNRPLTDKAPAQMTLFNPADFASEKKNSKGVVIEKHHVTEDGKFVSEYYDDNGKNIKTVYTDAENTGYVDEGRYCMKDVLANYQKGVREKLEESIYPGLRRHTFFEPGGVDISRRFLRTYSKDDSTSISQKFQNGELVNQTATNEFGAPLEI